VHIHLNVGTAEAPLFDTGARVQVGPPGDKFDLAVGERATPCLVDWNEDGLDDLLVGALDGKLRLYYNEGGGLPPDLRHTLFVADAVGDLVVPYGYSSPAMADFDGDGAKDLIVGNAEGELYYYRNTGTHAAPAFVTGWRCESESQPLDLGYQARSRPFVCDWDEDGRPDLLVGSNLSKVHLFLGLPNAVAAPVLPPAASLGLPWPNPANPQLSVDLVVARAGRYEVRVLDAAGRRVGELFAGEAAEGSLRLSWDGRDGAGRPAASGLYLLEMEGEARAARKFTLIR
jgi:hypothetical protein